MKLQINKMSTKKASNFKLENADISSYPISKEQITSTNAKTKIECEICQHVLGAISSFRLSSTFWWSGYGL